MDVDSLNRMTYRELQKTAKELGIKANCNKSDLVQGILKHNESETLDDVDVSLIAIEETKLNETFDMDNESQQNKLNETFELERTGEKEKVEGLKRKSRFIEFSEEDNNTSQKKRNSRSVGKRSSPVKSRGIAEIKENDVKRRISSPAPKMDYLTKKNNTPLRSVAKTPGSITKRKVAGKTASNIPRFVEFAHNRGNSNKRIGRVPNFAKMHEKNFKNMDSITDTIKKQMERTRALTQDHNDIVKKINNKRTPGKGLPLTKNPDNFVPKTMTTAKMNLNFGGEKSSTEPFKFTAQHTFKAAANTKLLKPRKDLKTATMKRDRTPASIKKKRFSAVDTPDTTKVLANITNNSVVGTPGKKFDIKASLARPLNYKPHKGKLAPLKDNKEKTVRRTNLNIEETRQKQMGIIKGVRMNKRAQLLMMNRQIE